MVPFLAPRGRMAQEPPARPLCRASGSRSSGTAGPRPASLKKEPHRESDLISDSLGEKKLPAQMPRRPRRAMLRRSLTGPTLHALYQKTLSARARKRAFWGRKATNLTRLSAHFSLSLSLSLWSTFRAPRSGSSPAR